MLPRPTRIPELYPLVQDPPFELRDVRSFLFVVPCERARLDALLARTFDWARPEVEVEAFSGHCLVVATDVRRASSAADPQAGWFAYREVTTFVPVTVRHGGTTRLAMHVPFIYPDSALAIAAGREVYGLPKKPAQIQIPADDDFWQSGAPISVRAVSAAQLDGSQWIERTVLTIDAQPAGVVPQLVDVMFDALEGALGGLPGPLGGLGRLLEQDLVQLKQVADVKTGGVPAHVLWRGITTIPAPLRAIRNVRLGDASKVRLRTELLATEPLQEVLGLAPVVVPVMAASFDMDFSFEPGTVLLERPDGTAPPSTKTKVLILGGGMAALTAAHALSDTDARRAKYDVRVLSEGHYLGGKGANTRNPDPGRGARIEEHGLHVIFGFYHNFLRLFRSVYADAARPPSVEPSTFDEAFKPEWNVIFDDGTDSFEVTFPRTPAGYGAGPMSIEQQLEAVKTLIESIVGGSSFLGLLGGLPSTLTNRVAIDTIVFTLTLVAGALEDIVVRGKSWEELDALDFREWMARHKLPLLPDIQQSAIMQVPYDGVFAYEGADQSDPKLSAMIAARGLLKLVSDYEKAPYFVMTAGMGECVFAPMYDVLRHRGVNFEFFGKVKEVHTQGGRVDRVRYARQAIVTAGPYAYSPLVMTGQVPSWRHAPDLAQLDAPAPIAGLDPFADTTTAQAGPDIELHEGADYDWVICTLPAPVTARVLSNVTLPALARIALIPTVATLHLQAWLDDPSSQLGWRWRGIVLGGFRQPLNSMLLADHLLNVEQWPPANRPRGLLYASGPFGGGWSTDSFDPASRAAAQASAQSEARTFVEQELARVLDGAALPPPAPPHTFDVDALYAPISPADPLADQYIRGNIDLSSRYVLALPGGLANRPRPDHPGLVNLRFAGDWTHNGVDIPCMEGVVRSALIAVESILGESLDILD